MNTVSQANSATRPRKSRWLMICGAVVVIAVAVMVFYKSHNALRPANIRSVVDTASRSEAYVKGGELLAKGILSQPFDALPKDEKRAVSCRLVVDFLRNLTPEQLQTVQQGQPLSFAQLNPYQQRALFGFGGVPGIVRSNAQQSFIMLDSYTGPNGDRECSFSWLIRGKDGVSGYTLGLGAM